MQTKVCARCKKELPATNEYFNNYKHGKYGLGVYCRDCSKEMRKNDKQAGGTRTEKKCLQCGTSYYVPACHKDSSKYCSRDCQIKAFAENSKGEKSKLWKEKMIKKCEVCGKEMHLIPSRFERKRFCSRTCHGVWTYQKYGTLTEPEKIMQYVLKSHGIEFDTHKTIDRFNIDFLIKDTKIAIEVDGDYWHWLKEHRISDPKKDKRLTELGYAVVRITETEIHNDIKGCMDKILKELRR